MSLPAGSPGGGAACSTRRSSWRGSSSIRRSQPPQALRLLPCFPYFRPFLPAPLPQHGRHHQRVLHRVERELREL